MNHPFSLSTAELAIADLSFSEVDTTIAVAGAGQAVIASEYAQYTKRIGEGGGHPFPIDLPIDVPVHPPIVIHPQPTPRPHPRTWPRPRPGHPPIYFA